MFGVPMQGKTLFGTDCIQNPVLSSDKFTCLEHIDISGNVDITLKGIFRYVSHAKTLKRIILSATSSTEVHETFMPKWKLTPAGTSYLKGTIHRYIT